MKIRVGLRGAAGLLGSRFAATVARVSDMELSVGIFKNDATLARMLERHKFGGSLAQVLPRKMYLDEPEKVVAEMNDSTEGALHFLPLCALDLKRECDIVVDAAASSKHHALQAQYQEFPGCVILQDGSYPYGRLIAPPLITPPQGGNRYRQGGCFLSGVVPVLTAFQDILKSVRIYLVMQYDGRDTDFTITERLNTFRVADAYIPRMNDELSQLFPETEIVVGQVIQIPGMLHYSVNLEAEIHHSISKEAVLERLANLPRVRVLPDSVMSTYEVNLVRVLDEKVPPIMVFGGSLQVKRNSLRMMLALYYRTLAVLPNIDAVRMLARGMDPMEAMKKTDEDMGF